MGEGRVKTPSLGAQLQRKGLSVPLPNRFQTMQPIPHTRSRIRPPREISLLRKATGDRDRLATSCAHCHRTPLVGEHVHVYGERLVCQLCRHLRREPPGETVVMHSPEHLRAVKAAVKLRPRAA
jgi:hypothetical protein